MLAEAGRQIGEVLGVDYKTVVNDRHAGESSPAEDEAAPPTATDMDAAGDVPHPSRSRRARRASSCNNGLTNTSGGRITTSTVEMQPNSPTTASLRSNVSSGPTSLPAVRQVVLNGAYLGYDDGTATWSQALSLALPGACVVRPSFDPTRRSRVAFSRKIVYELGFRRHRADLRVHPYWACALDSRCALVVLDSLGAAVANGWQPMLARASLRRARLLATISRQEQATLEEIFQRRFAVLTPFPDPRFFELPSAATPSGGREQCLRVAYWGGWHERKAVAELLETLPPSASVHFYCTGRPPACVAQRPDVTCVGRLTLHDLIRLIDSAHVALYPSRAEGLGLPLYEALLRGRPVIVRDLPCYSDYLREPRGPGVIALREGDCLSGALERARRVSDVTPAMHLQTAQLSGAIGRLTAQAAEWLSS